MVELIDDRKLAGPINNGNSSGNGTNNLNNDEVPVGGADFSFQFRKLF